MPVLRERVSGQVLQDIPAGKIPAILPEKGILLEMSRKLVRPGVRQRESEQEPGGAGLQVQTPLFAIQGRRLSVRLNNPDLFLEKQSEVRSLVLV